jgi:hypothetical protein
MKYTLKLIALVMLAAPAAQGAEPAAKQFLRYIYGAEGINLADISHPSVDLWMLRGAKNAVVLAALDAAKIEARRTGVISGILKASENGPDLYFIETRDGLVDPAFNLDGVYFLHRQLVLHFIYAALGNDDTTLRRLATDDTKIEIVGPRAQPGEMGQYGSIIQMMPVVRSSNPGSDSESRNITYRVPVGDTPLLLTLVKQGSTWKIDTSNKVRVPLEGFFR